MEKKIPKNGADCDGTLDAVLTDIAFRNDNNLKLTGFKVTATEIILTYNR